VKGQDEEDTAMVTEEDNEKVALERFVVRLERAKWKYCWDLVSFSLVNEVKRRRIEMEDK
jgi:hypothetical protein